MVPEESPVILVADTSDLIDPADEEHLIPGMDASLYERLNEGRRGARCRTSRSPSSTDLARLLEDALPAAKDALEAAGASWTPGRAAARASELPEARR